MSAAALLDDWGSLLDAATNTDHDKITARPDAESVQDTTARGSEIAGMPVVTKQVVTAVSTVRGPVRTESTVFKSDDAGLSRTVSREHFTQQPAPDTWTGDEAALCEARAQAFRAKGIPAQPADMLACSLMRRDRQLDDRRSCAECMSFHEGHCLQRITPIGETTIHTLHRCKGFKLNEVFHD